MQDPSANPRVEAVIRKYKNYDENLKSEIIKFVQENSLTAASKKYGVAKKTIRYWLTRAQVNAEKPEEDLGLENEEQQIGKDLKHII